MQSSYRFRPRFGKLVTTPDTVESKEKSAGEYNILAIIVSVQFKIPMLYSVEFPVCECALMLVGVLYG